MNNNILNFKKNIYNKKDYKNFYIQKLTLKNFRNHGILNLNLKNSSILIYGENGCGKTNILEAISLLSQGKGLRKASIENFLIQEETFNDQHKVWGINVDFVGPNGKFNIGTGLNKTSSKNSRIARVNSDYAPLNSLGKILNLSWITPQLCVLFLSSMSEKRRFIDRLTSSIDSLHLNRVYRYEKLLRQRNKILMKSNFDHTWLDTIEFQISELSIAITARRLDLIDELENLYKTELKNNSLTEYFPSADIVISGKIESLLIEKPAADVEDYIASEPHANSSKISLGISGSNINLLSPFNSTLSPRFGLNCLNKKPISIMITDFTIMSALINKFKIEKSELLASPTAWDVMSASI